MSDLTRSARCWNAVGASSRAIRFYRYNSMLSGAATHTGNALSTAGSVGAGPFRTLASAAIEPFARRAVGAKGRQRFFSEAGGEVYGWFRGMPDFMKKVGRRARQGAGGPPGGVGAGGREIDEIFRNAPGTDGLKKIVGLPMRLMSAVDQWFYDRAFHGSVYRQAIRQAKKTGRAVQDVMNEQSGIMRQIESLEEKIDIFRGMRQEGQAFTKSQRAEWGRLMKEADELYKKSFVGEASLMAEKQIFTSREGESLDQAMTWLDKMSKEIPLIDALFPFRRTPANIVREILRSSPAGVVGGAIRAWRSQAAGVPAEQIAGRLSDDLGQALAGTAMMYWILTKVHDGTIKANPYKERERAERVTEEAAGVLPDTVQIGDYSFPVGRLEPLGSMFLAAAKAAEAVEAGEIPAEAAGQQIIEMTKNLATTTVGDTFFDPFATFAEALEDDKSWARWAERFGGSFVPRAVTQFDPRIREDQGGLLGGVLKQVPGQGEAKLGLFGKERGAQTPILSALVGRTGKAADPVATEMARIGAYHLPPDGLTPKFKEQLAKRKIGYTDAEDRTLRKAKGMVQELMVKRVIESPSYQDPRLTDMQRKELVDKAFKDASTLVNQRAKALKLAKVPLTSRALIGR